MCVGQLIAALSSAQASLSAFTKQHSLTVEEVESVQGEWRDLLQQQQDVDAALAQELSLSAVDDEQVEAEYQAMVQSESVEEPALSLVPTPATQSEVKSAVKASSQPSAVIVPVI